MSEFADLPTMRPLDVEWLEATTPLLLDLPAATAVIHRKSEQLPYPIHSLEHWLAFFSAAVALGRLGWAQRHGAVAVASIEIDGAHVDVIAAHQRLALLVVDRGHTEDLTPRACRPALERATRRGSRYSMHWAAAAYALDLLERVA